MSILIALVYKQINNPRSRLSTSEKYRFDGAFTVLIPPSPSLEPAKFDANAAKTVYKSFCTIQCDLPRDLAALTGRNEFRVE